MLDAKKHRHNASAL